MEEEEMSNLALKELLTQEAQNCVIAARNQLREALLAMAKKDAAKARDHMSEAAELAVTGLRKATRWAELHDADGD